MPFTRALIIAPSRYGACLNFISTTVGVIAFDVPEPGTLSILATGEIPQLALRRRRPSRSA